jgi:hypothetical protein
MDINLVKRYQTLIVLWFALLMSVGMYFLFTVIAPPRVSSELRNPPSSLLMITLTAFGALFVIVSFAVKRKLLERSVEQQDVSLVQKSLVIACAMCEVSALLGLVEYYLIASRVYYLLFLLAAAGIVFHFPRHSQLEAASYKNLAKLS